MDLQHTLLAVYGDKILRLCERVDDLQLLLTGMAGDVEHIRAVVNDLDALAEQLVDDTRDGVLIAGNGGSRDDDAVARLNLHLPVL